MLARAARAAQSAKQVRTFFTETLSTRIPDPATKGTVKERIEVLNEKGQVISPWHDIPLKRATEPHVFNFVCEIPRDTTAKYEISTKETMNPIMFDTTKEGRPRHYAFRSLVNYGALPQTYEDPEHKDEWTGEMGDGDPIDVCDISTGLRVHTGSVYSVKVLGALALLDGGETDWKILAVRTDDPRAGSVSDIKTAPADVLRLADDIRAWFRTYKVPEGKPENEFAFGGAWQDRDTALAIIESTHKQWRSLLQLEQNMPATLYGKQALKTAAGKRPWVPAAGWQPFKAPLSAAGAQKAVAAAQEKLKQSAEGAHGR